MGLGRRIWLGEGRGRGGGMCSLTQDHGGMLLDVDATWNATRKWMTLSRGCWPEGEEGVPDPVCAEK